jgi:predicted DNA-binding transcriptional regulator YafY
LSKPTEIHGQGIKGLGHDYILKRLRPYSSRMPKKLSDLPKHVRQQKIYNILRHITSEDEALSVSEIHHRLTDDDVVTCLKTIKRDLEEMSVSHKFMATETMPARFFCSDEYEPDYQLTFNESELKTIALALQSLKESSDHFQKSLCEKTETILMSKLPREIAIEFEKLKALTIVTPGVRGVVGVEDGEAYKLVLKALTEGKVIECENHSPYKDKAYRKKLRVFSPIKLNMVGSEQYLMAMDHEDKEIKRLKICRMKNVKITSQKVDETILESKNLESSIGGFGGPNSPVQKYEIHCDELMGILFQEKKIHPSQVVTETKTGFIITFETNPSIEIPRYLAGWAKHIQRIEPASVYDEVKDIWSQGLGKLKLVA